jgi:hypothetical protein
MMIAISLFLNGSARSRDAKLNVDDIRKPPRANRDWRSTVCRQITRGSGDNWDQQRAPLLTNQIAMMSVLGPSFAELQVLSDEQLSACAGWAHEALGVLFCRYHRLILNIGFKILRDHGEAEDLAQSVFLECYRVAGQFDPTPGSTRTWLLQYVYQLRVTGDREQGLGGMCATSAPQE